MSRARNEAGAVLILALVFMILSSLVIAALLAGSGNDLLNSGNIRTSRQIVYAADGAIQASIYNLRNSSSSNQTGGACNNNGGTTTFPITVPEGPTSSPWAPIPIYVYCQIVVNQSGNQNRTVTLAAVQATCSGATCFPGNFIVEAVVVFNDLNSSGQNFCPPTGTETSSCGTGMTIQSWLVQPGLT